MAPAAVGLERQRMLAVQGVWLAGEAVRRQLRGSLG